MCVREAIIRLEVGWKNKGSEIVTDLMGGLVEEPGKSLRVSQG